jgi:hypothetical protein
MLVKIQEDFENQARKAPTSQTVNDIGKEIRA